MKNTFLLSIVIAAVGGVSKLFLQASGGEKAASVLQSIVGILLLVTLLGGISDTALPSVTISPSENKEDFAALQKDTMEKIIYITESELAEKICLKVESKFGTRPSSCITSIETETLTLAEITVCFSAQNRFLSAYAVKNFLQEEYNAKAEVIFD